MIEGKLATLMGLVDSWEQDCNDISPAHGEYSAKKAAEGMRQLIDEISTDMAKLDA